MKADQRRLLDEARRSIEAANLLSDNGYWGYAASRSYYAMFYAAQALLLEKDLTFSRHSAVISAFGREFAKTGEMPIEFHRFLIEGMELRQAGDYGSGLDVDSEQSREQIRRAQTFLTLATEKLRSA